MRWDRRGFMRTVRDDVRDGGVGRDKIRWDRIGCRGCREGGG